MSRMSKRILSWCELNRRRLRRVMGLFEQEE